LDLWGERKIWVELDLWGEPKIWVRILVSCGFECVNTVFEGSFGFGRKDPFSTRTMSHDDVERGAYTGLCPWSMVSTRWSRREASDHPLRSTITTRSANLLGVTYERQKPVKSI
jgi:hypothetical protein